ncbi:hypothetical protein BC830DRAFT_1101013 [Chytriomyces sp. MP71]|nr:hypothetical protein BC830DRAFT_1101013 [Chytriomyces sp. MP71]
MESVLDSVQRHCGSQLKDYGACIDIHQPNFEAPCLAFKQALTLCAETNVASVREVKTRCLAQIQAYENCVQGNKDDTPSKCADSIRALYACTHRDDATAAHSLAGVASSPSSSPSLPSSS